VGFVNLEDETRDQMKAELAELRQQVIELESAVAERREDLARVDGWLKMERAQRQTLERQIERRRLYLESVLSCAPDAIVTLDHHHNVIEWNDGATALFGYTKDEVIGSNLDDLITGDDEVILNAATDLTTQVLSGKHVPPREAVRYRKDGTAVTVVLAGSPIVIAGELVGVVAVYSDVTEYRKTQAALQRSEGQYRSTLDAMADAIHVIDADFHFTLANPALKGWAASFGFKRELVGFHLLEVFPFLTERIIDEYRWVFQTGERLITEETFFYEGAEVITETRKIPIFEEQKVVGIVTVLRDITERRRADQEIQRRTAQLEALREVALELSTELDLNTLLRSILSRANVLLGGKMGGFYLHRPELETLELTVGMGDFGGVSAMYRLGEGFVGRIWEQGIPMSVTDQDPREGGTFTSFVGAPVRWGDELLGVLVLGATASDGFSTDAPELLELFANQVAAAIHNARLFEGERKQRRLTEALAEAAAAVSTLDLDQVLDRILDQVERVLEGDAFNIALVEDQSARIVRYRGRGRLAAERSSAVAISDYPYLQEMVLTGKPVVVADVRVDPNWVPGRNWSWRRSYVGAPIVVDEKVVGFLNVAGEKVAQFGQDDARWLKALAYHAAIAVKNAQLYSETVRRLTQTQVLRDAMVAAASTLDFDNALERTCRMLQDTMGVDFLGVLLPTEDGKTLRVHSLPEYGRPLMEMSLPVDDSVCGRVFATGEAMIIDDVREVPYYHGAVGNVRSELALPLRVGERIIGVLDVESRRVGAFDQDDLTFYSTIAAQLGIALENARLYQEVSRQADELGAAVLRLQELDRLKSQFVQNVSHELRSPLALIRGYAEVMGEGDLSALPSDHRKAVEIIVRRSRMLSELVRDITLLLEAEANPPLPEPVQFEELARAAVEDFQVLCQQNELALEAEIPHSLPAATGSPIHLRRVLDNLLSNAIKFTPEGGRIALHMWQEGDIIAMQVRDTGIGIPPDQLGRVFDRFYQVDGSAKRRYGGVGLGLTLVKEIVELYGGGVVVESQVDEGSAFTVRLPLFSETRS
jgi:PAS domain S-box-containing protein